MPLVYTVAHRYRRQNEPLEDLVQEGAIGLMKAVDHFDPHRGVRFSTFACYVITRQILNYLRDCGHLIRQPAWVQELNTKIYKSTVQLTDSLGREPTVAEIADEMGLTEESVQEVLDARALTQIVSLTVPSGEGDDQLLLFDVKKIRQKRHSTLRLPLEDRIVLEEMIGGLKQLEQRVLRLFFFGHMTLSEIGHKLNITTPRSAYLLRTSLGKVKAGLEQHQQHEISLGIDLPAPDASSGPIPLYDKITGIYSGSYLRQQLMLECQAARETGQGFALLIFDVVGAVPMKRDSPLFTAIGHIIARSIHSTDIAAYLDNGRFGVLLYNFASDAQAVCTRISGQIALRLEHPEPLEDLFTLHAGMALFPQNGTTVEALLRQAEATLGSAGKVKRRGRPAKIPAPV